MSVSSHARILAWILIVGSIRVFREQKERYLRLHGFSIAQTVFYFKNYKNDRHTLQMTVIVLRFLDTTKECITIAAGWTLSVFDHNRFEILLNYNNFLRLMATTTVLASQLFFLYSVWRILPKALLAMPPVVGWMILAFCAFLLAYRFQWCLMFNVQNMLTAQLAMVIADDILLAATLCYLYIDRRDGTSIICLFYFPLATASIGTCYVSSFSLNARRYLRDMNGNHVQTILLTTFRATISKAEVPEIHTTECTGVQPRNA
ncbi:hypothetical protein WOLCODRAFT_19672 [Wolfiporia cocos MD-104 SS10]|uniref:Uncharacterized protein n=1 Tax=Wolfiporia cocos (strain MD-104) TaxID=742152 RepID=A0A2H3IYA5_WOLCO|nr:hypothetical protein WOLCODRAFT_19672 [Wolfiporia cocos MD-104 SS10]